VPTQRGQTPQAPPPSLEIGRRNNAHNSPPYPCGTWLWRSPSTGEIRPFRCGSWRCPRCSPHLVHRWTALLAYAPIQRHLIFTALGHTPELARRRLQHITQAIRRGELGPLPRRPHIHEYFAALEGHEPAGYHAHLLQWGHYLPHHDLSALAARYHAGRITWARAYTPRPTEGDLRRYVVRHLIATIHPHQHKPGRRVRYTRNFWQGRSLRDLADYLWPPDPEPWELLKPDLDARAAWQAQWWEGQQALHEDRLLRTLPEHDLLRRGIIFPAPD